MTSRVTQVTQAFLGFYPGSRVVVARGGSSSIDKVGTILYEYTIDAPKDSWGIRLDGEHKTYHFYERNLDLYFD